MLRLSEIVTLLKIEAELGGPMRDPRPGVAWPERQNIELGNKSLGMEATQQTVPVVLDLDTFDLAGARKEARELAASLIVMPDPTDVDDALRYVDKAKKLAGVTQLIDAWIDNLPSEMLSAGDALASLSEGKLLLLCDLHIHHFEKMVAAGKRGAQHIRLGECENYLLIWKSSKRKIEAALKESDPRSIRELLSEEEQTEFDDALASGEYDEDLANFEDK